MSSEQSTEAGRRSRSGVFVFSDIHNAAEEFVETLAEHAETIWDEDDKIALTVQLTAKAIQVLRDSEATW